ncbi:penicillin-binding transpeptidase domain-containing protein [Planococcus sp. APC 3906]|uniref:penicillin-binding transpeptidase domain-containing protein n=1 Tax=Planococcus sp. APC 3906 TaxID=3035194 RepID=UPI0025B59269|nr:penicillin-binding transpeptidase domain-containing protein [Planococcus sp. APC 3906]MDN3449463.1 penicillin-binding transpeptidase domain-containing protein [Planococcus sp. APC 3906]
MEKKMRAIILLLFVLILSACQDEPQPAPEAEPEEETVQVSEEQIAAETRLTEFIELWQQKDFARMYDAYLNEGTKAAFGKELFVDWQQELHSELAIQNLAVNVSEPAADAEWSRELPADFKLQLAMDSAGGPVEFTKTMSLLYENSDWFIEWDPSFILPGLERGDTVSAVKELAPRADIVDRNGKGIAVNAVGYEVGVIPEKFDEQRIADVAALLDITPAEINDKLGKSWVQPNFYVPLAIIREDQAVLDQLFAIPGTVRNKLTLRSYPYGEPLSHISGFVGPITAEQLAERKGTGYETDDVIGRRGLEESFEDELRGVTAGRILIKKANGGETVTASEREAAQGEALKLSLDAVLQNRIYNAMDGKSGAAAAIDPKTGEVLALVSSPGFDPNLFIPNIAQSRYRELANDPRLVFFNRFAAAYTPGAALNPLLTAAGLEAGTVEPDATNKTLRATANNLYDSQLQAQGSEAFAKRLTDFGFGEAMPFTIELTPSTLSLNGAPGSAGQVQANILHLAALYTAFQNGGAVYEPTLLAGETPKVWIDSVISEANIEPLQAAMRESLDGFTGSLSLIKAQGNENGLFIGYPTEEPPYVLALLIEDVENEDAVAQKVEEIFNK